ncbi:hypothetical protein IM793_23420 [Pedobacter sp. MR2016-19]|uniref:hypothetical protein n=1 Tax=Pedobacter sp. MR2016-19 TaxID=2780089 RepID=UPI001873E1E4|nr:hypothetical protein [Pedobacter sp. MR2016-19]MBE5322124.1 hypothetical protein [Pedobacter sp. MR2016-19]
MGRIDYAKLLRDKRLDIAIGIGYEFAGEKPDITNELNKIVILLNQHKFIKKTGDNYDTFSTRKPFILIKGKAPVNIDIYVYLTSSYKKNPAQTFGSFLATKEIVIYSGHARVGIGPDFDDNHSNKENFIIGLNTVAHANKQLKLQQSPHDKSLRTKYLKGIESRKDNDLENITKKNLFKEDLYQVWFFNACSSIDYIDEIRGKWSIKDKKSKFGLVKTEHGNIKSRDNLVFFGTNQSVYADAEPILKSLLEGKSMEDIIKTMYKYETDIKKKNMERDTGNPYFSQ